MRNTQLAFFTITFVGIFLLTNLVSAQIPPPPGQSNNLDNFLDDEEFDGPPPGTYPPQQPNQGPPGTSFGDRKSFGNTPSSNAPDSGSAASPSFKGASPLPRRNRKEPPNLLAKQPVNMSEAQDKDITDENFPDLIDSFDYPNAEITDIVKAISELTGKNFIVDPQVRGKITIIAPTRITVAEAYKAFLSALAINGLAVVPSGKFLKVKQAANAVRDNLDTYSGTYSPNTDTMITRIVQLRYIQAKEIYNSLGPLLQSRLGEMRPYEPTNTLIISDYGSNIERIMKILRQLDVPGFEEQLEVIRIRYAKSSDIAKLVDQIINKGKSTQGQGSFTAGIPRFTPLGSSQSQGNEAFSMVIPDDRTNSLIVVGNNQGIEKIRKLVAKLDFKVRPEDAGGVYVYYVRYGDAEKISTTLSGLAQAAAQSSAAPPGGAPIQKASVFSGDVKIVADKTTNSLVVTASKQDYEVVQAILSKLDVARDQVYVEGIFMELNVDNIKQWGISYYALAGNSLAGRAGFSSLPLANIINPPLDSGEGAVLGFGAGETVNITPPGGGTAIALKSLTGFINFLSTLGTTNILSTPQIMALDNEEAEIEVGEKVPTSSSSSTAANGTSTTSVQREDLTIKLNIKPHISPGSNTMRLEINQSIQGVSGRSIGAANLAQNAIATTKRLAKTSVMVRNGDTIVLGGLMSEDERVKSTKVPLLGDIPIIGWLFKSKRTETSKQNLLMFLTPKIIRNKEDAANNLTEKLTDRVRFIERNLGGRDNQGDAMDQLKLKRDGKTVPLESKGN
ncbi:MAG: type II secretion system secretin GspD [Oligoflexia bacterium]|nr:type II secretion system secretin GspD [Oligoflexia bacterium]